LPLHIDPSVYPAVPVSLVPHLLRGVAIHEAVPPTGVIAHTDVTHVAGADALVDAIPDVAYMTPAASEAVTKAVTSAIER
jgi:hypothetical protein